MGDEKSESVDLRYSEVLLRSAVNRWWLRVAAPWLGIALIACGAPLAFALAAGDRSWFVGALGAAVLMILLLAQQSRSTYLRSSITRLRLLRDGRIRLTVSGDGLAFESSSGSLLMRWSDLTELRVARDYWLLLRAPNDFSTLPLNDINLPLQEYMLGKFRAAGVRVRTT